MELPGLVQYPRPWSLVELVLRLHVIGSDLTIPLFFLREQSHLRGLHICFRKVSLVSVHCLDQRDSAWSVLLRTILESLYHLPSPRKVLLSAVHVPDMENVWADALLWRTTSLVGWSLTEGTFEYLVDLFGLTEVDHLDQRLFIVFLGL